MRRILPKNSFRAALALSVSSAALFSMPAEAAAPIERCGAVCTWSCGFNDEATCNDAGGEGCHAAGCAASYFHCSDLLAPNLLRSGSDGEEE